MAKAKKLHFISLPVSFLKEGEYFIAYSPALDLSTSGKTFEEVKRRFEEVVQIFFEELSEKGTTEETLSDLGWQRVQKEWVPPTMIAQEAESFRVPLSA
jgi:predicted RNase H-like HicB family nuclease